MTVRRVDDEQIDARFHQRGDALIGALAHADGRADAKLALLVLARVRVLARLQNILDRHQPAQLEVAVDDQHALEPVLVHQCLSLPRASHLPAR